MANTYYGYILVFCLLIGITQLVGGSIRLMKTKHVSKYSNGLNRYFTFVIGYFLSYLLVTLIHNTWIEVDQLLILFIPILPICIAIYYWVVIYTFDRSEKE